jgi:hypothetical protein
MGASLIACRSLLWPCGRCAAKADIAVAKVGRRTEAAGDSHIPRTVIERTAFQNVVARTSTRILHPFPNVSQHVKESVSIRHLCSHGMRTVIAVWVVPRQ